MTSIRPPLNQMGSPSSGAPPPSHAGWDRWAGRAALVAVPVAAAGIVFLVTMYAFFAVGQREAGLPFGMANDVCVATQYLLMVPVAVALHTRLRTSPRARRLRVATCVGLASFAVTGALQVALVAGWIAFAQQVPLVAASMLFGTGFWLWVVGAEGRATGALPVSTLLTAWTILYFAFPVWAWRVARVLGAPTRPPSGR